MINLVCSYFTVISISCLHFGQNSGKFFSTVSERILIRVLFLQTGHNIHSILHKQYSSCIYLSLSMVIKIPSIASEYEILKYTLFFCNIVPTDTSFPLEATSEYPCSFNSSM